MGELCQFEFGGAVGFYGSVVVQVVVGEVLEDSALDSYGGESVLGEAV